METINSLLIAATADNRSDSNDSIDNNQRHSAGLRIAHATVKSISGFKQLLKTSARAQSGTELRA